MILSKERGHWYDKRTFCFLLHIPQLSLSNLMPCGHRTRDATTSARNRQEIVTIVLHLYVRIPKGLAGQVVPSFYLAKSRLTLESSYCPVVKINSPVVM